MISGEMDYESDLCSSSKPRSSCWSNCEAQICCSYVISILSSLLIAGGFYLTILKWDHLWLILPIVGSILIFIGACMYYSGQMNLNRRRRRRNGKIMLESHGLGRRHRRSNKERGHPNGIAGCNGGGDNLISSASSDGRSLSQLSINMIPQYFANSDLSGSLSGSASMPYSQILRVNGQSFLILPLTGETSSSSTNPNDTAISLQNLMVKMPCKSDQQSKPEGSDIYKKMEELPNRIDSKDYTTFTTENCLPSSSISRGEHNIISLDNRSAGMVNFTRESESGSHGEYHYISNYFATPRASSSNTTHNSTTLSQLEAQASRVNNIRMASENMQSGSQPLVTNNRSSLIQQHSLPVPSSSGPVSSTISSSSSSSRRPLLRRDTFNKGKPSMTTVKSTNQPDLVHAQANVITDPSISSSSSILVASKSNNKRTGNNGNRSVSNSLRLLSSQPGSAGSCNNYSSAQVSTITQLNISSNPNINSSSSPTSSSSSSSSSTTNTIPNSMIPRDSLLSDHRPERRTMDTNSNGTFMCGGNLGSTGDSDTITFDENLIESGTATPPPSYEEVLSVETIEPAGAGTRNSIAFDTL